MVRGMDQAWQQCCSACSARGPMRWCTACDMVSFCNTGCQRKAWPQHKEWCKLATTPEQHTDESGYRRLLFDRAFGTASSLFAATRFREHNGPCLIVADLSHPAADFCGPNRKKARTSNTRLTDARARAHSTHSGRPSRLPHRRFLLSDAGRIRCVQNWSPCN